jgi:hypothetical protein
MGEGNGGTGIANPKPFNGTRSDLKRFVAQCENFFDATKEKWQDKGTPPVEDHKKKIGMVLSHMSEGIAADWAMRYIERPQNTSNDWDEIRRKQEKFPTYEGFLKYLQSEFKDTHSDKKARAKLTALKQGNFSVDSYTSAFNDISKDTGYNDAALMEAYYKGLNSNIQNKLDIVENEPTTLEAMKELAIRFDTRMQARDTYYGRGYNNNWRNTNQKRGSGTRNDPIHVDRRRLSTEEVDEYRRLGKCFNCGEQGHITRNCPKRNQNPPRQQWNNNKGWNRNQDNNRQGNQNNSGGVMARVQQLLENVSLEEYGQIAMAVKDYQPKEEDEDKDNKSKDF